jgi:hypothetical protein
LYVAPHVRGAVGGLLVEHQACAVGNVGAAALGGGVVLADNLRTGRGGGMCDTCSERPWCKKGLGKLAATIVLWWALACSVPATPRCGLPGQRWL